MTARTASLHILVGTNGTGKSTTMKKLLAANARNLVCPSNRLDDNWRSFPELSVEVGYEKDDMSPDANAQRRAFVVKDMRSFTGTKVLHIDNPLQLQAITDERRGFTNGGLFLDDFRNYIPSKGQLPPHITKLFTGRRHRMVDITLACHAFQDMNLQLMQFQPRIFIFRTTLAPNDSVMDKVTNGEGLLAAVERVNRAARTNPYACEVFDPA